MLQIPIDINKTAQLVLLITYLYYTYQVNKDVTNLENHQYFQHKIGLAMGAVVGLTLSSV